MRTQPGRYPGVTPRERNRVNQDPHRRRGSRACARQRSAERYETAARPASTSWSRAAATSRSRCASGSRTASRPSWCSARWTSPARPRASPSSASRSRSAAARRLAADVNRERAHGQGRRRGRQGREGAEARPASSERTVNTFGQAARDFIENHAKPKTRGLARDGEAARHRARRRGRRRAASPTAGPTSPSRTIDGHDIHAVTDEARRIGVPGRGTKSDGPSEARARHLFSALSKMFSWLHRHRRVESNPCAGVHRPEPGGSRDRVLTGGEIKKFWMRATTSASRSARSSSCCS